MIIGGKYAIGAGLLAVVVGVSFWAGVRFEAAGQADERIKIARAYADHANSNFEALRTRVEAAERRAAAFNRRRDEAVSRAQELEHALANLPSRPSSDFTDDELRILTEIHGRYFPSGSSGVPGELRGTPAPGESKVDVR